jgi:hypothetical protein
MTSSRLLPTILIAAVMPLAGPAIAHASTGQAAPQPYPHRAHAGHQAAVISTRRTTATKSGSLVSA